ncbi:MAG: mandelate racemase/muconate lactonizing enzyme family protein [Alphaproteobacteria bacterium]|nr:mandelate racemase/muconate lactonizing enzyme family protein [Alphaproteobacteria bacterium]
MASASPIEVAALEAFVFRTPIATPVVASFGRMTDRPMVLVRVADRDGAVGWGEVWCNFPNSGAEHRARLIAELFRPLLVGKAHAGPAAAFEALSRATRVLAIQTGEPGPLAQCVAGIDTALWDLVGRRAQTPLWRLLGGQNPTIPVYASGLNPDKPEALAAARRADGHTAFKLKVGFGAARDLDNLRALRASLGDGATLMVDANQAWDLDTARAMAPQLAPFALGWLEEPIAADHPWSDWRELANASPVPLAGGENIAGHAAFDAALAAGALRVIQPDVAKWGGITGCLAVARRARAAGRRYCPHYLGGGWGQRASAHLLAAVGGDGLLEIDSNENPLRTLLMGPVARIDAGSCTLDAAPGLGDPPDLAALRGFQTLAL